jgi:probable F420-dependent oxidoreductase
MADGESQGLGSALISERYNIKEAATLSGAVGASSKRLGIATAATNQNTRHPLITASIATTMHRLTGGRYTLGLGLGRGVEAVFGAYGLPSITTAQIEDFVELLKRLWWGEVIFGHDGPAGSYPILHLDPRFDEDIPVGLVAFGPNSLALAGRAFDMVVLHTFFTDETVTRAVSTVRLAAERVGRDPSAVRIWSCYATIHDELDDNVVLKKTVGRPATYLQGYGDLMVSTNGWDPAALAIFRAVPVVATMTGAIDAVATPDQLEHIATLLPEEWLEPAAIGPSAHCAAKVLRQFDLGVDGVIMQGATPAELAPIVTADRSISTTRPVRPPEGEPRTGGQTLTHPPGRRIGDGAGLCFCRCGGRWPGNCRPRSTGSALRRPIE